MIKLIDIDAIFEKQLRAYMQEHAGELDESAWEEKIAELYEAFGHSVLPELGTAPENYYSDCTGRELAELLSAHVKNDVAVSDYLCEAIIRSEDAEDALLPFLDAEEEELAFYAMNLLKDKGSVKPLDRYLSFIVEQSVCQDKKDLACEILIEYPDRMKEKILSVFDECAKNDRASLLDILSRCNRDDRILNRLTDALRENSGEIPLYVSFIRRYGDERALNLLYELIEREEINYQDFQELKLAIEALGGEYEKERDFSNDKIYRKIMKNKLSDMKS